MNQDLNPNLNDFKKAMIILLEQNKLQHFIDNMKQMKLVHNQLKIIAPITCNTCGILKPRCQYQRNGLKKCKDCLGFNKRTNKRKQREKVHKTINDINKQFLLFHKYVYTKNVKEGWVRKLIHKTGEANNITDITNVININIKGIDHFCDQLHKHYMKQEQNEYYKYYYFDFVLACVVDAVVVSYYSKLVVVVVAIASVVA